MDNTTKESPIETYHAKLAHYRGTIRVTWGCGTRVQSALDKSYEELKTAYENLSPDEKNSVSLPERFISKDDGTGGFSTGLAMFGQSLR